MALQGSARDLDLASRLDGVGRGDGVTDELEEIDRLHRLEIEGARLERGQEAHRVGDATEPPDATIGEAEKQPMLVGEFAAKSACSSSRA